MMKTKKCATAALVLIVCALTAFGLAPTGKASLPEADNSVRPDIAIKKTDSSAAVNKSSELAASIRNSGLALWSYKVTNTGNVKLTNIRVADGKAACPQTTLAAGESMNCSEKQVAEADQKHKGCVTADHVSVNDVGVKVTTKGDCDKGT